VTFTAGRLVDYDGKPIDDATFDILRKRPIDERMAAELSKEINVDFVEQPLKDVMMFVGDLHAIPTAVDLKGGVDVDLPITATSRGMDLQSALVLMLAPHGLACDYRYGALWITKSDCMRDWRDPTGVADIKPPSGSALARAWNEPIAIDCTTASLLVEVLDYIEQKMAVSIDAGRVQATLSVAPLPIRVRPFAPTPAATLRNRPLRHVLGHLLYNCGCRCKLEGETLVILPPEE